MSDNVTYIPNRLKNAAKGGYVTGASDIVDDAKGKDQQTINQETDEAILRGEQQDGYLRARIEAEEITRERNDNLLNQEINAKQLEIGAVETDIEPIPESPNMLPSGAVAFNLGYYIGNDNPEWIYIITDGARRILAGIKKDGSVEWMVGVPTPVKNYVDAHIQELIEGLERKVDKEEGNSLINKDYADGITYIENPEFKEVKIDNEGRILEAIIPDGTKLLPAGVDVQGTTFKSGESPEFLEICFDKKGRILYGVQRNGNFIFGSGVPQQIKDYFEEQGGVIHDIEAFLAGFDDDKTLKEYLEDVYGSYEENPEFVEVKLDANGYILWGIRKDGDIVFGCGIPSEIQNALNKITKDIDDNFGDIRGTFHYISSPEYLFACLDAENRFLYGVTVEGKFRAADLEFELPEEEAKWLNTVFSLIGDPEGRIEITLDGENKVLSWRNGEGVKHETNLAIENSLELSSKAMTAFQQALKDSGFTPGGGGDYSDTITEKGKKPVYIPTPRLARVNIIWDGNLSTLSKKDKGGTQKVNYDVKVPVEFFDGQGIYFKKYALMSAQGNSSFDFEKKNISLKFFDTEDVEGKKKKWGKGDTFGTVFGSWVMQKTYHLKAFHTDFIRGSSEIAYQLADEVYKTRGIYADRPWKKALIDFSEITSVTPAGLSEDGVNDMNLQIDNGARCMPDGFPVIVYQNGEFYGIYVWMLKKDADNFNMDTSKVKHIHLDGILDAVTIWGGNIDWTKFEIRNPEDLVCMDGSDYDGDFPAELIDDTATGIWDPTNEDHVRSAQVKQYIIDLSNRVGQINTLNITDSAAAKELFDTYFDADNLIDYQLINMAVGDWDGFRKNWQWTTWDGVKWYANQYDKDCSFGNFWTGMFTTAPSRGWMNNNVNVPSGLAVRYYTPEHKTRWQELVNAGIFNAEHIKSMITAWISRIGKDNFVQEWKKWPEAPCNRDSKIDFENWVFTGEHNEDTDPASSDIWNANESYSIDDEVWFPGFDAGRRRYTKFKAIKANQNKPCITESYSKYPMTMGYRDSVWRFYKYIEETISNQNSFINSL